jgi:hypothetical protein
MFQSSKVLTKICTLSCTHISLKKKSPSYKQFTPPQRTSSAPPEGQASQFGNVCYVRKTCTTSTSLDPVSV